MKTRQMQISMILIILMISMLVSMSFFLTGCVQDPKDDQEPQSAEGRIRVVTTLFPLYEFAREVGGDRADVTLLLPAGAEPHSYEPRPSDIIRISEADVFIYAGQAMEPWTQDLLGGIDNKDLKVVDSSRLVTLIGSGQGHDDEGQDEHDDEGQDGSDIEAELLIGKDSQDHEADPHFWLDLGNDQKIVSELAVIFSEIDPDNSAYYDGNAQAYIQRLQSLDERYRIGLADCSKDKFLVGGHNFFAYLENRYGIKGISAIENLEPNTEPTPGRIRQIADLAREHDISYILTEVLVSKRMSEAIAGEVGATVLTFSPASNLSKDELSKGATFLSIMEENLQTLKIAMECS